MDDEEQEARAKKFEPRDSVTLRKLSTGRYAMYPLGGVGSPFWIGPLDEIEAAYAARPLPAPVRAYIPKPVIVPRGIDLGKLEFTL